MAIDILCGCGLHMRAKDDTAGRRAKCPACGCAMTIPGGATPAPAPRRRPRIPRGHAYVLFLLGLVPLAWCTLHGTNGAPFADRLDQTLAVHPELAPGVRHVIAEARGHAASPQELRERVLSVLPGHRLEGAHLGYDTWAHWLWGLASAAVFLSLIVLIFPPGTARLSHLLLAGLFSGTLGTLALLGVQWVALRCRGAPPVGYGGVLVTWPYYLLKFIGLAYRAAVTDKSFGISLLGFTGGVALCEELCKAMPLICYRRLAGAVGDWRRACMWGLVSGAGFGVSEAIACAGSSYNGLEGSGVYFMRFISCVALHAIWAASVAVALYGRPPLPRGARAWHYRPVRLVKILGVPVLLHGLYDTLLQRDSGAGAIILALASFVWLAWQIESCLRRENQGRLPRSAVWRPGVTGA